MRATHVADVSAKTLREVLTKHADRKSAFHTDESLTYGHVGKDFAEHKTVNHSEDEYFKDGTGVQSAEAFFALLKRGVYGSFHSVSEQHLQRYCTEFELRGRANGLARRWGDLFSPGRFQFRSPWRCCPPCRRPLKCYELAPGDPKVDEPCLEFSDFGADTFKRCVHSGFSYREYCGLSSKATR